jgi:hypothetical protein
MNTLNSLSKKSGAKQLVEVLYKSSWQEHKIQSILRQAVVAVAESKIEENLDAVQKQEMLGEIVLCLQELLLDEVVSFKNPAFKEEKEWRLIVKPSLIRDQGQPKLPKAERTGSPFKFRQFRGALIPYIELLPMEGKMPLRSIRFGPSLAPNRTENALGLLLAGYGYEKVEVTGSDLPVIL